jgi:hypothetical protein
MAKYFTKAFWNYAGERAIKTAAQTALATIGTATMITEIDWAGIFSIVATATLLSLLTSVASDKS